MALDLIDLSAGMLVGCLKGLHQRRKITSIMKKDKRALTVQGENMGMGSKTGSTVPFPQTLGYILQLPVKRQ